MNTFDGLITLLYPDNNGCFVRLDSMPTNPAPKSNYFQLTLDHANYSSLFSLLTVAATNRLKTRIRIFGSQVVPESQGFTKIGYVVVMF